MQINSDHFDRYIPSQLCVQCRDVLPCTIFSGETFHTVLWISEYMTRVGCEWYDPTASWCADAAIFTRILLGFNASRVVYWILAEEEK